MDGGETDKSVDRVIAWVPEQSNSLGPPMMIGPAAVAGIEEVSRRLGIASVPELGRKGLSR